MRILAVLIAVAFLGSVLLVHAQESKGSSGPSVYKVEFDVQNANEGESRQHFSMLLDESRNGVFHAGDRVAVDYGSPSYIDVGTSIECAVHESEGRAALAGSIELSSITGHVNLGSISEPIIGQKKIGFDTKLELGKAGVIVDERNALVLPAPPGVRKVEVTVTKVR